MYCDHQLRESPTRNFAGDLSGLSVLHAPRAAGPVAIVKIEPFALQDECADAILFMRLVPLGLYLIERDYELDWLTSCVWPKEAYLLW